MQINERLPDYLQYSSESTGKVIREGKCLPLEFSKTFPCTWLRFVEVESQGFRETQEILFPRGHYPLYTTGSVHKGRCSRVILLRKSLKVMLQRQHALLTQKKKNIYNVKVCTLRFSSRLYNLEVSHETCPSRSPPSEMWRPEP